MRNPKFHNRLKRLGEIHDKKNNDYAEVGDPYKNFRACEAGGIQAYKGCYVRLLDKVSRVSNFIKKGEFSIKDETFQDTCDDGANYFILLGLLYEEFKSIKRRGK